MQGVQVLSTKWDFWLKEKVVWKERGREYEMRFLAWGKVVWKEKQEVLGQFSSTVEQKLYHLE
jgi:hypothetical protein